MNTQRRVHVARILGIAAVAAAFSIIMLGWWALGAALALGIASRIMVPAPARHGDPQRIRRALNWLYLRTHPHPWRPRPRR